MKLNKILILFLILITSLMFITSVSAEDTGLNLTGVEINDISEESNILTDNAQEVLTDDDCCGDSTVAADNESTASEPKTVIVNPDPENPNQVQKPTVQPAIDNANPGDTIILNGTFVHCHFTINKNLTILATPGTSVGVCPHHNHPTNSTLHGIFYITSQASGTTINGFSFTNNFYNVAFDYYNPFGILVDGASDIRLENLTFNWIGTKVNTSDYDPNDFKFNPIILNNTKNIIIADVFFNNTNSLITIENSTNIQVANSEIRNVTPEDEKIILNSKLSADNLNVKAGDVGSLKITLTDENNKTIANKTVYVIIDGNSDNITTDANGTANLTVKFDSAATKYATLVFADDDYKTAIATAKIVVSKKTTTLTAPKKTFKVKATKKIAITLKSGKTAIVGKKITVKIGSKTYSAKTNAKGIANIKVKITKKGSYKYTAKFAGNGAYKAVSKIGKIVVKN